MKHGPLGPKNQGSLTFAALASVLCLGFGMYYSLNKSKQTQMAVDQAMASRASELGETSNLSNLALVRGLLAERQVPGQTDFQPAVYPDNYFAMNWNLQKNKAYALPNVESMANRIKVRSFAPGEATLEAVKGVFEASKSQTDMMTDVQSLEIVALNRSSEFPYYVASIDVKAGRKVAMKHPNQKEKDVTTYGRINLSAPIPQGMRLTVREESETVFTENFGTPENPLKPGKYVFRLEGSGVIHHGEVIVNGDKKIVGLDNKGNITHVAHNIRATSIIGETPVFDLRGKAGSRQDHVNKKGCDLEVDNDLNPGSGLGGVTIVAKLIGVDGSEAQRLTINRPLIIGDDEKVADQGAPVCANACSFNAAHTGDAMSPAFAEGLDRSLTSRGGNDVFESAKTGEVNSKKGRGIVCSNYELTAQEIRNRSGMSPSELRRSNPAHFKKLLEETISLKQYVAYMAPACQREVVGLRQGCGCFEEKTEIQMADGSSKLASEIRAGDLVFNPKTGKAQMIRKVIAGPERWPMLEVKAGGKSVIVTGEHPFLTKAGLKPAYKLSASDILVEGEAETEVEAVIKEERKPGAKAPEVWNFELAGSSDHDDHYVLANGVMTGDLYLQQKLGKQGAASRQVVSE